MKLTPLILTLTAAAALGVAAVLTLSAEKVEADGHMTAEIAVSEAAAPEAVAESTTELVADEVVVEEAVEETAAEQTTVVVEANPAPQGPYMGDLIYGDPNASVTVVEYASLSCGHCGSFHRNTFPAIKAEYVDTGKVRFVYRDYPTNDAAWVAAVIARCGGESVVRGLIETMYQEQDRWLGAANPYAALLGIARTAGLTEEEVNACMQNRDLINDIAGRAMIGQTQQGVTSTPSFVIDGQTYRGDRGVAAMRALLDPLVAQ